MIIIISKNIFYRQFFLIEKLEISFIYIEKNNTNSKKFIQAN